MEGLIGTLGMLSVVVLALNFLPSFIAAYRGHNQTMAIVVLNVVGTFGWLFFVVPGFVLWAAALVWSCTSHVRSLREDVTKVVSVTELRVTETVNSGSGADPGVAQVIELDEVVRIAGKVDPVTDPAAARAVEFLKTGRRPPRSQS